MYQTQNRQLSGLGLSLKPPKWLRNAVGGVVRDTVDAATKAARESAEAAAREAAARLRTPPKTPVEQVNEAVAAVPGGWLTIAALGIGALMLLKRRG